MKNMIASLLIFSQLAYAGRLQDADFKTEAELVAAGSSAAQLLNDSKVYVTANGLNKKLSTAITDGDIGGGGTSTDNKLTNPGFEKGTTGWTASGGTFASTSTASEVFEGTKAVTWDSSAAAQTLTGTAITVGGFAGQNAELTCNVRVPSGTATHTLGVWDGTTLSSAVTLKNTSGNTNYVATTINFIAPSSGTVTARFTSATNEPSISIDDCYLGKARNIGTISQAYLVDSVKITGCSGSWSQTSTVYASAGGSPTGCVYTSTTGACGAPDTNLPAVKCSSIAAGTYVLDYEGSISVNATQTFWINAYDGTLSASEESQLSTTSGNQTIPSIRQTIRESAPKSNVTFQFRSKVSAGTANMTGTTANPSVIRVWYFPSASQQAVAAQNADYDWTSYTPTFSGFGSPTNIEFRHKREGSDLLIRGKFTPGTTTATEARISLPTGLTSAGTSVIPSIQMVGSFLSNNAVFDQHNYVLIEPSVTYLTIGQNAAGNSPLTKVLGTFSISGRTGSFVARVPIEGWSTNQKAPILVGSVTSNSNGAERIERVSVTSACTTTPCTIASQSGSWISSITRNSTGNYSANISTAFSATPTCTLTCAGNINVCTSTVANTSTSSVINFFTYNTNNTTLQDSYFNLMCMGPR